MLLPGKMVKAVINIQMDAVHDLAQAHNKSDGMHEG